MATNPEYSWDDLEKVVGEDFSDGEIHWALEPVEWTSIRRYCEAIESDFPLFHTNSKLKNMGTRVLSALQAMFKTILAPVSGAQAIQLGGQYLNETIQVQE